MTKEELKEAIFSGVILDSARRSSLERFIDKTDDLTLDNFQEKYSEWINGGRDKKVASNMTKEELKEAIFSGVILDPIRRSSLERFIDKTDDLTLDNFNEKYSEWINGGKR